MPTFEIELWENGCRQIPQTDVKAKTRMQARALGLGHFRRLGIPFTSATSVEARDEDEDEKQWESARVSVVVEWARSKQGMPFIIDNGLVWLLSFQ